jgi:hypothetical protein
MESDESLDARKRRAKKIGIITGVVAFVVILGGAFIAMAMGFGAPMGSGDDYKRGQALSMGAAMMSFWIGLITWGVTRLVLRVKANRPKV